MDSNAHNSKHAIIFGASGVTGWAFVNEMLHDYPSPGTWGRVTAMTNRPLSLKDSMWPADERLNIVSGVDLLEDSQEQLDMTIKKAVPNVETVTHCYYLAFKAGKDMMQEFRDAEAMFRRSVTSIDRLSPELVFVVLQTGAKMYGCHLLENHYLEPPLTETLPRLKQPYHDQLFYHPQLDWLADYAKDKNWTWCETRPDIIIGFVPNNNFYSLGTMIGIFLALFMEVNGKGAECSFPGSMKSWRAKSNDSSSDMIARQTIHLSLRPESCGNGNAYNVADHPDYETWETKWPQLCSYFDLHGVSPHPSEPLEVRSYISKNLPQWKKMEQQYGLKKGVADSDLTYQGFEYFLLTQFDFDRQYDMSKLYNTGFQEKRSIMESWGLVFDRMREAKIIP